MTGWVFPVRLFHSRLSAGFQRRTDRPAEGRVADLREMDGAEVDPVIVDQFDGVDRGDGRQAEQVGPRLALVFPPAADDVPRAVVGAGSGAAAGGAAGIVLIMGASADG